MNRCCRVFLLASVLACASLVSSVAVALHVGAASPDGSVFIAGGDNRVLYVFDTAKWEVTKRIWLGSRIRTIQFTQDGSQCVVGDDHAALRIFNPKDWSKLQELRDTPVFAMAAGAPVAVTTARKAGGGWDEKVVRILSLPDWKPTAEVAIEKGHTPIVLALSADGKTVYVRTRGTKDDEEKKAAPVPKPKDWSEEALWRARTDGRVSALLVIDVAKAAVNQTVKCFDSPSNFRLYPVPKGVVSVVYGQYCGWLDAAKGAYTTQMTKQFAYGSGQDRQGNLYIGSMRSYLVLSPDGKQVARHESSKLPGFPEYFRHFEPLGDGLMVGVTDASRLILIDAKTHAVTREVNCY